MIKKILLVIIGVIVGIVIYAAILPSDYKISRELAINAKAEKIFPYINNSKKSNDWMPWTESDPQVKMIYTGSEEGVGSVSTWDSTGKMGTGKAEVVESILNKSVKTQLTYTKPMQMVQLAEITLSAQGDKTIVNWSVTGKNNFIGRIFCIFMNMDKMVGSEFEKGLNKLKKIVESK